AAARTAPGAAPACGAGASEAGELYRFDLRGFAAAGRAGAAERQVRGHHPRPHSRRADRFADRPPRAGEPSLLDHEHPGVVRAGITRDRISRTHPMKATLVLENGLVYEGEAAGAPGETSGEVVFNTS